MRVRVAGQFFEFSLKKIIVSAFCLCMTGNLQHHPLLFTV